MVNQLLQDKKALELMCTILLRGNYSRKDREDMLQHLEEIRNKKYEEKVNEPR